MKKDKCFKVFYKIACPNNIHTLHASSFLFIDMQSRINSLKLDITDDLLLTLVFYQVQCWKFQYKQLFIIVLNMSCGQKATIETAHEIPVIHGKHF